MKMVETVSNIIITKKFNSKLTYNKKYLKAKKVSSQKKAFNILIYQQYWLIQFIGKMKIIIPKCFCREIYY